MAVETYQMWINGVQSPSSSGETLDALEPYSRKVWATVPAATTEDVDRAVRSSQEAFQDSWWRHDPRKRSLALLKLADLLEHHVERLSAVESRDNGKTIRESLGANRANPAYYRYAAGLAMTMDDGEIQTGGRPDLVSYSIRQPFGVLGVQVPWNTPLQIMGQSCAPALAAGNVLVVKPSEYASCSVLEFGQLADEAGFPPGVVNIVTGLGPVVGAAVSNHPDVRKIIFTGSPEAGRIVAGQGAARLVPVILELGGKSPNIVFDDADLDRASASIVSGITGGAGQSCVAGSRALIHAPVYSAVLERVLNGIDKLVVGDPGDPDTDMGPLCTPQQLARVQHFVSVAQDEGATLVCGGVQPPTPKGIEGDSLLFSPTVFADVRPDMTIAQEEVFGPVLSVFSFADEDEALRLANDTRYGLAAGVWTRDLGRAHRMAGELNAGTVWVNNYRGGDPAFPFGGVKESGYGRENGRTAFLEMTQVKSVQVDFSQ
ncbi:MAG TPA: aldehyde dehydrogenase family protein [Acidimicrobiales bacterium]|nr:aldehyde dehydrogenase family protein [Acidimicrobiales bacterium]